MTSLNVFWLKGTGPIILTPRSEDPDPTQKAALNRNRDLKAS